MLSARGFGADAREPALKAALMRQIGLLLRRTNHKALLERQTRLSTPPSRPPTRRTLPPTRSRPAAPKPSGRRHPNISMLRSTSPGRPGEHRQLAAGASSRCSRLLPKGVQHFRLAHLLLLAAGHVAPPPHRTPSSGDSSLGRVARRGRGDVDALQPRLVRSLAAAAAVPPGPARRISARPPTRGCGLGPGLPTIPRCLPLYPGTKPPPSVDADRRAAVVRRRRCDRRRRAPRRPPSRATRELSKARRSREQLEMEAAEVANRTWRPKTYPTKASTTAAELGAERTSSLLVTTAATHDRTTASPPPCCSRRRSISAIPATPRRLLALDDRAAAAWAAREIAVEQRPPSARAERAARTVAAASAAAPAPATISAACLRLSRPPGQAVARLGGRVAARALGRWLALLLGRRIRHRRRRHAAGSSSPCSTSAPLRRGGETEQATPKRLRLFEVAVPLRAAARRGATAASGAVRCCRCPPSAPLACSSAASPTNGGAAAVRLELDSVAHVGQDRGMPTAAAAAEAATAVTDGGATAAEAGGILRIVSSSQRSTRRCLERCRWCERWRGRRCRRCWARSSPNLRRCRRRRWWPPSVGSGRLSRRGCCIV